MKIEMIRPALMIKKIVHYSTGGRIEKKFESKDKDVHYVEFLKYLEDYCNENGFSMITVDQGIFYIKKE
jgi:hypothetical protein